MNDVFVIAEVGVNHDGSLDKAAELVVAAADVGADAVKFQAFTPDVLEPPGPRRKMLQRLVLSENELISLADIAHENDLDFMCTPFDVPWLEFLIDSCLLSRIKLAAGSITDLPLLRAAAATGLPVILSTGMATRAELGLALNQFPPTADLTLLYCVSAYPTSVADLRLGRMAQLYDFRTRIGLSDHTVSTYVPAMAAMLGATVIEKHLTYTGAADEAGPDHRASLQPHDFADMVAAVRLVPTILRTGPLGPLPCETSSYLTRKEREAWRESSSATAATVA